MCHLRGRRGEGGRGVGVGRGRVSGRSVVRGEGEVGPRQDELRGYCHLCDRRPSVTGGDTCHWYWAQLRGRWGRAWR